MHGMKRRAESREGMVVTTVALSPELHRRLHSAGYDLQAAQAELIRQALEEFLDRHDKQKKKGGRHS
jgi:predicted transcriptional regulator